MITATRTSGVRQTAVVLVAKIYRGLMFLPRKVGDGEEQAQPAHTGQTVGLRIPRSGAVPAGEGQGRVRQQGASREQGTPVGSDPCMELKAHHPAGLGLHSSCSPAPSSIREELQAGPLVAPGHALPRPLPAWRPAILQDQAGPAEESPAHLSLGFPGEALGWGWQLGGWGRPCQG